VAFNAKTGSSLSINGGTRAVFNSVDINIGGGYNALKGIFNAPKAGIYVFEWTILTQRSKSAYTALMVNGKLNSMNYCYNNGRVNYAVCSKMSIVRMEAGQAAWIKSFSGTSYINGGQYSSFAGFIL
jgi:hypothetical protein